MNELQIHLLFNHVPVIGVMAATLMVVIGIVTKQSAVRSAGLIVYILFALAVVPTYVSGEGAEERVEHITGIDEHALEEHEDMSIISLWATLAAAAIALGAFVTNYRGNSSARAFTLAFVVVAVLANIHIGLTAHEGGKIRRPDLQTATSEHEH